MKKFRLYKIKLNYNLNYMRRRYICIWHTCNLCKLCKTKRDDRRYRYDVIKRRFDIKIFSFHTIILSFLLVWCNIFARTIVL